MRVLAAMAGAKHGGAEAFFERLTVALHTTGVDIQAVIRGAGGRAERLRDAGVPLARLPFGGWFDFATKPGLTKLLRAFRPAIVLSFMSRAAMAVPPADALAPFIHVGRLGGYYDLKYYERCDHLIANTEDIARHIRDGGWPAERVHYVPNFVDSRNTAPEPRERHRTPADAPLLVALGRLHTNKGFDTLFKALVDLPDAYLWLAGAGPEDKALRALATELDVIDRIRFLGWRDDPAPLFAAADVIVVPSRHEPLGNVVIEAWARAKPVVATASEGPRHLIASGENGFLVPVDEPKALAYALRHVIDETSLNHTLAEGGYRTYLARFTEAAVVGQYLDLFARLLAARMQP